MKGMKTIVVGLMIMLLLLGVTAVKAQQAFKRNDSVLVVMNNDTLLYPWVGGLNNPQFWAADLNNDGILDLVVFNRGVIEYDAFFNGNKVLTFINHGTPNKVDYVYAPQYQQYFPGLSHYLVMVDMNCDGVADILTSSNTGSIIMYLGHFDAQNHPYFPVSDTIKYFDRGNYFDVPFLFTGIPAAVDVDGDGDVDILAYDAFANAYVNEFQNMSVEYSGNCGDSIIFTLAHYCWGDMSVSPVSNHVNINDTNCPFTPHLAPPSGGHASPRHNGGTICALDLDGDHDYDLLLGDISYNTVNRVINGGTPAMAHMIAPVDSTFPSYDRPVQVAVYPAAFNLDVNNDGKKDLLVAPNLPGASENYACSWYYKNISTTDTQIFHFQTDTFMVNQMIDLGEGAFPAFTDIDGDGLMDLVVGNTGYFVNNSNLKGELAYFRNVGTQRRPMYQLVTRDYANVSSLRVNNLPVKSPAPTFADMDGDGDMDMIVGDDSGVLQYYENTAGAGHPASYTLTGPTYFGIDVGNNSVPFVYDVNGDSLPDLIIGQRSGSVYYYQNNGSRSAPHFDTFPITNASFGNINVITSGDIRGNASPVITPIDSTGDLYVLVGSLEGKIFQYKFNKDSILSGSFDLISKNFAGIDEGERTNLTVFNDVADGNRLMVTGNNRGGLSFYVYGDISIHDTAGLAVGDTISIGGTHHVLAISDTVTANNGDTITINHNGTIIYFVDTASAPLQLNVGDTVIVNGYTVYLNGVPVGTVPHVGIEEVNDITAFNLYPNPASGQVTLMWQLANDAKPFIELTDMVGRKVLSMQADGGGALRGQQTIDISHLSKGIYTCRLIANGHYVTKKLLVQ